MLPADQLQTSLTAAQQDTRTGVSPSRCAYPLGPLCADGPLGVGAFGAGAVLLIAAVAILARGGGR